MNDKSRSIRSTLRRAEAALSDPELRDQLEAEGVSFGEPQELSAADFLRELQAEDQEPRATINVVVYLHDTPVSRQAIEDPLSDYIECEGIGEWVGSGQGSLGGPTFFDITFSVHDPASAIPHILEKLRELKAGPSTEVEVSDGTIFKLL